jgi:two-component system, OmpR family, phosphate regulon sensor histidine kinase PhoR
MRPKPWHIPGVVAQARETKEKGGAQAWAERGTKNLQRLGYRRIVQMIIYLLVIPTVLLLSIGIFSLFLEGRVNFVFGILMVCFVAVMITGMVLVLVFLRREANLSELQADFVSKVSHEFRTPLTAIRLFAETLERAKGDPETQAKCVAQLRNETERLTRLIERLLDFGRMQAGRKVYELREERIGELLYDVEDAFAPYRTRAPDLDCSFDVAEGLEEAHVRVDRAALTDVLVNLLSNALKYGGSPPVVRLVVRRTKDGRVAFDVTDNGEGIPRHERDRIFQKFYRIDDRLSRSREGSGLGLAIVKHVAKAHGAKISVESTIDKGSTFSLVLPKDLVVGADE